MTADAKINDQGYSPPISAVLELHGKRFNIAVLAPDFLTIKTTNSAPAGIGTIYFRVDAQTFERQVDMTEGINPKQQRHPYRRHSAMVA